MRENRKHQKTANIWLAFVLYKKPPIFVGGLSQHLAASEVLKWPEYFGKFGKIREVVISHSPSGAGPRVQAQGTRIRSEGTHRATQRGPQGGCGWRDPNSVSGPSKYCSYSGENSQPPKRAPSLPQLPTALLTPTEASPVLTLTRPAACGFGSSKHPTWVLILLVSLKSHHRPGWPAFPLALTLHTLTTTVRLWVPRPMSRGTDKPSSQEYPVTLATKGSHNVSSGELCLHPKEPLWMFLLPPTSVLAHGW